jgi:uncharacterized membrane protein YfcA
MAIPGGVGAFLGAVVLSSISAESAKPFIAVFLFGVGVYVLARFSFRRKETPVRVRPILGKVLGLLRIVAGFLDAAGGAAGGGGWGPISTLTLLSSDRMEPRKSMGTVDSSEFVVAFCASVGFLLALSLSEIPFDVVGALLVGGLVAAPVAAWLVRILPMRILGTAVGGVILITNMRTFLGAIGVSEGSAILMYILIIGIWLAVLVFSIWVNHQTKSSVTESETAQLQTAHVDPTLAW